VIGARCAAARPRTPGRGGFLSNFHVKIDGCVGQSFNPLICDADPTDRSVRVVLSYIGVTKAV